MKKVVFKNEYERLDAWMRELLRLAKSLGVVDNPDSELTFFRLPEGLTLLDTGGKVIVFDKKAEGQIFDNLISFDKDGTEISFETETSGEIMYSSTQDGEVQTMVYLPDGLLEFGEEADTSGKDTRIDLELEKVLSRDLSSEYRRAYMRSLEFFKKIENIMPGELRESLDSRALESEDEKETLISQIKSVQLESGNLDRRLELVSRPIIDEL